MPFGLWYTVVRWYLRAGVRCSSAPTHLRIRLQGFGHLVTIDVQASSLVPPPAAAGPGVRAVFVDSGAGCALAAREIQHRATYYRYKPLSKAS